jgi:hypothetical protein
MKVRRKKYVQYSGLMKEYALRLRETGIEFAGQLMIIGKNAESFDNDPKILYA